jgi:hypothetical protein
MTPAWNAVVLPHITVYLLAPISGVSIMNHTSQKIFPLVTIVQIFLVTPLVCFGRRYRTRMLVGLRLRRDSTRQPIGIDRN